MRQGSEVAVSEPAPPSEQQHRSWPTGLLCGALALVIYTASVSPGVEWQDPGRHQYRILTGQMEHPCGLALSHPLHFRLARLALALPFGEPAWRMNMVSAICGAAAIGVLAALVVRLTNRRPAAFLAAGVLLVAHSYWQMSCTTETYTLAATLMVCEWLALLQYARTGRPQWLVLVFALNGLHIANHLLGLIPLATYGVLLIERSLRRKLHPGWLLACAAVWIAGSAPYWTMVLDFYARTHDLRDTLHSTFFGGGAEYGGWAQAAVGLNLSASQLKIAFLSLGYNFPSLTLLIAALGLLLPMQGSLKLFRWVLLAQTVLMTVFVMRYRIADLYTFFVPLDVMVALWFGLSAAWIWRRLRSLTARRAFAVLLAVNAVLPPAVYVAFPILARQGEWMEGRWRHRPHRDEYNHFFRPWLRGDHSAAEFACEALERTGPGGWLLGESTTAPTTAYWYLVHGGPPGVQIFNGRVCLTADRPDLSDEELVEFVRAGGNVVIIAGVCTEIMWSPGFTLDQSDEYWWRISTSP